MSELGGRRLRAADLVTGVVLVALAGGMLAVSLAMPTYADRGSALTAPGIFPAVVAATLLLLGAALVLRSLRSLRSPPGDADAGDDFTLRPFLIGLALMTAAIALLGRVDFRLVVVGFCLAYAACFVDWRGSRRQIVRRAAATAATLIVAAVVLPMVFEHVFLVRLP